jgi:hypothetical protein
MIAGLAAGCNIIAGLQPAELLQVDGGTGAGTSTTTGTTTTTTTTANCMDGVKDGDETDVDCGGSICPPCAIGQTCGKGGDCQTGVCEAAKCVDFTVWLNHMGGMSGTDSVRLAGLGVDTTGNLAMAATFSGKASFGSAVYDTGSSSAQGFAFGRYDPNGKRIWDDGYVSGSTLIDQTATLIGVSASGSFVAIGGYGSQGIDFGNSVTVPSSSPASAAAFAVAFNAANVATWARKYGGPSGLNGQAFDGIALGAMGAFVAVGSGSFGSYNLTTANSTVVSVNNGDLFVLSWDHNWGLTFNDGNAPGALAGVAMTSAGDVIATGHHFGSINFGGGPRDASTVGQGFVVGFTVSGAYKWDTSFATSPDGIAVDPTGNTIVCGEFTGSVKFGMNTLSTSAPIAIFVAKLDPTGAPVWSHAYDVGSAMSPVKTLVATDNKGNILLAANTPTGSVDFGGGSLSGSMLVAKLSPSGVHTWSKGFGMGKLDRVVGIAAYDDTHILIGGNFAQTLQIGTQTVSTMGATDIFLAKLVLP